MASPFYVWLHRSDETDVNTQGVVFLLAGETFNITKNVLQVPIPSEDSNDIVDIGQGSFVFSMGGSKKTLRIMGKYVGSDANDAVNFYNIVKGYINSLGISESVKVDIYLGDPRSGGSGPIYSYSGVVSSMTGSLVVGAPSLVNVDITVYVGEVL